MDMSATLHIYEALTEVGVNPDKARNVERAFESAFHQGQQQVEKNILDRVLSKEDGVRMEQRLEQKITAVEQKIAETQIKLSAEINNLLRWMVGSIFAAAGLAIAIAKLQ